LKNKLLSLKAFVDYCLTSERSLNSELENFIERINEMAANDYSGKVRKWCLIMLNRIKRQEVEDIAYLEQFADTTKTSLKMIDYFNNDFYLKTPSGALESVVLSSLADIRRNLKFSIYQINRHIKKSKQNYSAFALDAEKIMDKLVDEAKFLGVNRFHLQRFIAKNTSLIFRDIPKLGIISGLFKKANVVDSGDKIKLEASNTKLLEAFMTSMTDIPINLLKIEKNMNEFKKSCKKNKPEKQIEAKTDEKKSKEEKLKTK